MEVVEEIYGSVKKEIRDEINIKLECLGEPVMIGMVYNLEMFSRPSAEFYTRFVLPNEYHQINNFVFVLASRYFLFKSHGRKSYSVTRKAGFQQTFYNFKPNGYKLLMDVSFCKRCFAKSYVNW